MGRVFNRKMMVLKSWGMVRFLFGILLDSAEKMKYFNQIPLGEGLKKSDVLLINKFM